MGGIAPVKKQKTTKRLGDAVEKGEGIVKSSDEGMATVVGARKGKRNNG